MPESKDDFEAAWAQIVDELTSDHGDADPGNADDRGTDDRGPDHHDDHDPDTDLGDQDSSARPAVDPRHPASGSGPVAEVPGTERTPDDAESGAGTVGGSASAAGSPPTDAPTDQPTGLDALFEPLRAARREPPTEWTGDTWEDEGHYVPPPPPELPEGTPLSRLAWAGVIGGPLILLLIAFTGWRPPSIVAYGAGLACLAGFATLVWQLPEGREDGWDDGSRL